MTNTETVYPTPPISVNPRSASECAAAHKQAARDTWSHAESLWPLYEAWIDAIYSVAVALDAGDYRQLHEAQAASGAAWTHYINARVALQEGAAR